MGNLPIVPFLIRIRIMTASAQIFTNIILSHPCCFRKRIAKKRGSPAVSGRTSFGFAVVMLPEYRSV